MLNKIGICEKNYAYKKSIKCGISLLLELISEYILYENRDVLIYACSRSEEILKDNPQCVEIALIRVFLLINNNEFLQSQKLLEKIKYFQKFFKNNRKDIFPYTTFLKVYIELKNNKNNDKKYISKTCEELYQIENYQGLVLSSIIHSMIYEDDKKIIQNIKMAYQINNKSRIVFLAMFKYFKNNKELIPSELIIPLFNWGASKEADIKEIVECNADKISLSYLQGYRLGAKLYKIYSSKKILLAIVKALMNNYDYSENAFFFYKEAVNKQIQASGLIQFMIKCSYKFKVEQIGTYPIQEYLSSGNVDDEIKSFIYHIILNHDEFKELIELYEFDIIKFGINAFKLNKNNRFYYSIYKYITDRSDDLFIEEDICNEIYDILKPFLFAYEIKVENEKAKFIRVMQKDKIKMQTYKIENQKVTIFSITDNFMCYLFDKENKEILTGKITKQKIIQNADIGFYLRLYNIGIVNENLLIAISKYFALNYTNLGPINNEIIIEILNKTLNIKDISKNIKIKILFMLGVISYQNNDKKSAIEYLKNVDVNFFSSKDIEMITDIYMNCDEIQSAVNIVIKKKNVLSDKTVFDVIRQVSKDKKYHKYINVITYELLIKNWYDSNFVEIVLENYNGSIDEWIALSQVLKNLNVSDKRLDEKIIQKSVTMNYLSEGSQNSFCQIYNNQPENQYIISKYIISFIEFLCFRIISENDIINDECIAILEKEYYKNFNCDKKYIIGVALCYIYANKTVTRNKNCDIIEETKVFLEKENLLFPIFSETKDIVFHNLYIDKNKAFIYKSAIEKNIYLFYRLNKDNQFKKIKMKYFRFGIYVAYISLFFGETIDYYFSEQMENGNIETPILNYKNESYFTDYDDEFFKINKALILEAKSDFEFIEKFITDNFDKEQNIFAEIL